MLRNSFKALEKGVVKWYRRSKSFGFITDSNGADVFVHQTNINSTGFRVLVSNMEVDFQRAETNGVIQAINVSNPYGSPIDQKEVNKLAKAIYRGHRAAAEAKREGRTQAEEKTEDGTPTEMKANEKSSK